MYTMAAMAALGALKGARDSQKKNQQRQDEMIANSEMSRYDPLNQSSKIDVSESGDNGGLAGGMAGGLAGYQLSDNMDTSAAARESYASDKALKDAEVQALAQQSPMYNKKRKISAYDPNFYMNE